MFLIDKSPEPVKHGDVDKAVVDPDRDVWLRYVTNFITEPGDVFKLVWHGKVIPFEVVQNYNKDEVTGEVFYLSRFEQFGRSVFSKIPPYTFASAEEAKQACLLAVEALLVFGGGYDGLGRPDGFIRVEFEGRFYTKKDFGIP